MSEDSEQDKSEAPTSFKLSKAREKGSIARGMDLGFATSLAAFCLYIWIAGPGLRAKVQAAAQSTLSIAPDLLGSPGAIMTVTGNMLSVGMRPLIGMAVVLFALVLVGELVQTGFIFTSAPLKPDFNKLNPAQNLKRLFSVRLLVETAKNILKLSLFSIIAYFVIRAAVFRNAPAITDAESLANAVGRDALRLLGFFVLAAIGFAVLDQLIVRRDYLKKMRMSRRDVRRESRDREGDPRMKQKRKQLHGEFVKLSQSLRGVRGADVMITNPTHFAVALKYTPATMAAPKVVSQGAGHFALRLKRMAFSYGIVIVEDKRLAQALYRCALGQPIPDELYGPVAAIYRNINSSSASARGANA